MQTERTHPVTHALAVAGTCAELALEAESEGCFPKDLAASLSVAADDAAGRLSLFLSTCGATMPPDLVHRSFQAQSDMAAIAQFAGLVLTYTSTPRNAGYLAKVVRRAASHAVDCLNDVHGVI